MTAVAANGVMVSLDIQCGKEQRPINRDYLDRAGQPGQSRSNCRRQPIRLDAVICWFLTAASAILADFSNLNR